MSREAPVVDALIGICVHDPDTFVEPPSVVRNWAAQALAGQIEGAVLSPEAKTAFLMTQGALSFEESEKAAAADLTDQMHEVMAGSGLDPAAYDLRSFTEELRPNLKILCMAAVRKEVPQVAPDEAKSVEATVSPVQVRKQRITPLIEAVQKQDAEAVRSLIQAGDDIEATDSYGQTALHWATKDKSVEIVQLLLEAGADSNAKDEDGYTPWQNAEKNANPAMAEAIAHLYAQVLLDDSDWKVRRVAVNILSDFGGPRARDTLQNRLVNDDHPFVAAAAREALSQLLAVRSAAPASRPAAKEPPKKRRLPVWAIVLLVLGAATLAAVGLAMVATEPRVVETPAAEVVALQPTEEEPTLPTPELTGVAPEPTVQRPEEEAKQVPEISPEPTESISELTPTPATAAASSDTATASIPTAAPTSAAESTAVLGEWILVDFMIPNPSLWRDTAEGIYTAVGSEDAFAWSRKAYDGNLTVSLDLESPDNRASGCVVVYGDGQGFSQGNLIFCVDWDGYGLEKHTIYHEGENYLTFVHDDSVDLKSSVYSVTMEIIDDVASMYVNGERVLSTFFDTEEINRGGRVGLLKKWFDPEITFSNVQIKALGDEDG